jgi:hypothetical protein
VNELIPHWITDLARQVQQAAIFRLIWTLPQPVVIGLLVIAVAIVALST